MLFIIKKKRKRISHFFDWIRQISINANRSIVFIEIQCMFYLLWLCNLKYSNILRITRGDFSLSVYIIKKRKIEWKKLVLFNLEISVDICCYFYFLFSPSPFLFCKKWSDDKWKKSKMVESENKWNTFIF